MLQRIASELLVVAALLTIGIICFRAALAASEGAAGAAVRFLATLLLAAILLSFTHVYFWPVSVALSLVVGLFQICPGAPGLGAELHRLRQHRILILPVLLVFTL